MSVNSPVYNIGSGFIQMTPPPVVATRAPLSSDIGYEIGTIWVFNSTTAAASLSYVLCGYFAGVPAWNQTSNQGGAGVFTSLVVTGTTTLTGTTNINTSGSATTTIGTGGTGAVAIGNATGNTVVTGLLSGGAITFAGTASINATGSAVSTIGTGGTGAVNIGNATGNTAVTGSLTASTSLAATLGNITASNGNVVLSTAATFVQLPGPIKVMSGAGAPSNGLAAEAGDMYIRTDPAGATSRIYVATGAGAWTNVTCAG